MEYRILGKTGLKISRMGFGGIPIQRIDAEGTKTLIHELRGAGVNFIDTARGYTVSEEYLGYALEGIREDFVIATKSMSRTKDAMAADIETSLRNLRTDYIDLYQIHNVTPEQLETILDKKESDAESSKIGVYNVNERLQLFFGPEAVMKYYSTPGKRTMVMLVLPIIREKEKESHAEG